ncbi:MAG: ABC transporter ATP-binding protein [Firmicutes bacterium]|nr:ABC transporter ATP-binding protein [Bacillota bacterium]
MVVSVNNLVKRFKELTAVDHLNLEIKEGEIFGLLGPNGSGKSTTINCILSLLSYEGDIKVFDKPMSPNAYDIKKDIGVVMQEVAVFDELNVYENINYFCALYVKDKEKRKKLVNDAIEFVGLQDFKKFFPKKLSGGLLRRLNIACGIAHKPKFLILDEPTVAVDPQSRNNILDGIVKLNKAGVTVLYTSHYMEEVEQICDRVAIMDAGKIIAQGTLAEVKSLIGSDVKITIELAEENDKIEKLISKQDYILDVKKIGDVLYIKTKKGQNAMEKVLELLKINKVYTERFYSEMPTLNDVFLELTGKELRDDVHK